MLENIRIVMVGTTHPGNIGAAARAMNTMGLSDLRLVAPLHYPHAEASSRASGSAHILMQAQVSDSLDEALADATLVVGTSARQRRIPWPCLSPRQLGARVAEGSGSEKIAILFGREDRGLTNDELHRCHYHVAIPTNPDYGVLNVAAAVQLLSYELRLALLGDAEGDLAPLRDSAHRMPLPTLEWDSPRASASEVEQFIGHFERAISAAGFIDPAAPGHVMTRMRRLFQRAHPDQVEINILRGILTQFEQHLPPPAPQD